MMTASPTAPRLIKLPDPGPERWPDYPLLAVRAVVAGEIVHGVLVADGGFTVFRATLKEAMAMDGSAADLGLTWSEALSKRFKTIRYRDSAAFFVDGWSLDAPAS